MANNIEIKARVDNLSQLAERVAAMAKEPAEEIYQDDTFFNCSQGRLKLRVLSEQNAELIFYRRQDQAGPKQSFYLRSATTQPTTMRESLTLAYGSVGRVIKKRTLYRIGRTRVHLDEVEKLGSFMELEVVMTEQDNDLDKAINEAKLLMESLNIHASQLIECAYIDLLANNHHD